MDIRAIEPGGSSTYILDNASFNYGVNIAENGKMCKIFDVNNCSVSYGVDLIQQVAKGGVSQYLWCQG